MWHRSRILYDHITSKSRSLVSTQLQGEALKETWNETLPKETQVVICGGGVMGAAVAYHLSLMNMGSKTIILESGR